MNESIEGYTRRFRAVLRIATRGHALENLYQVNYFIQGLESVLGYQVRKTNPANLNNAIDEARKEEEARNELYKKINPIARELQNKEVKNDEMDELINRMKRMEAHMIRINGNGHMANVCRENQREMNRKNNQVNYMEEEYYNEEYNNEGYDVYNMEQDEYDEYEYDEYDTYEMENKDYVKENDMYPAPIRRSERNKDRVMNDKRERRRNE
ncbi:hypothetical protein C1645_840385 [Glomus cerebriforme]|uniref:Retrotransposon gag domain-containing protein n=1 Tax=Glomus cerebriforme TaxID=658196 RepID=A0A397S262_9GLOM|nr:hypothetical protein C1645_840385 [Glomus cerebriforme]